MPIQFFHDGLPATEQRLWNSPWGKIGICVCYDLSYTRVTDELVRQGAQMLIVPTMDVEYWGRHQHELHSRVAPVRAAEYGIPIFRLCSSGISQAVTGAGVVIAQRPMPGTGSFIAAELHLPARGWLPLYRYLAPICVGITSVILALLLFPAWKVTTSKIGCTVGAMNRGAAFTPLQRGKCRCHSKLKRHECRAPHRRFMEGQTLSWEFRKIISFCPCPFAGSIPGHVARICSETVRAGRPAEH